MDNASKALIMAGAILISVAIVGIGIYIFSTASALTDDATSQMDALGVTTINARLERYFGDNVRGSQLKQLIKEVNAINRQQALPFQLIINNDDQRITYRTTENPEDIPRLYDISTKFKSNGRYKVWGREYSEDGYLSEIGVDFASEEEK